MNVIREWLERLYWFLYELTHPKFRCWNRCYDLCINEKCRKIVKSRYDDIVKWYSNYINCIFECDRKCTEKCYC